MGHVGCSKTPADVVWDPAPPAQLHSLQPVTLGELTVVDADGQRIEPRPALDITTTPMGIVVADERSVSGLKPGRAVVTVRTRDARLTRTYPVEVRPVQRLTLRCERDPCTFTAGEAVTVVATAEALGVPVDGVPMQWTSTHPRVVTVGADATLMAAAAGRTTLEARGGGHSATMVVMVLADAAANNMNLMCPQANLRAIDGNRRCSVRSGEVLQLRVESRAGNLPVKAPPSIVFSSAGASIATVSGSGSVRGVKVGETFIHATAGDLEAKIQIYVTPPECSSTVRERHEIVLAVGLKFSLECKMVGAEACLDYYASKYPNPDDLSEEQAMKTIRRCCCEPIIYYR